MSTKIISWLIFVDKLSITWKLLIKIRPKDSFELSFSKRVFKPWDEIFVTFLMMIWVKHIEIVSWHTLIEWWFWYCDEKAKASFLWNQRSYHRWLHKRIYKKEIEFWAVLGSKGCREEKLPTATSWGGFFNLLWAKIIIF